jgi:hypothetical protein
MNLSQPSVRAVAQLPPSPARERGRRKIVALVTIFYLLLIFEGALRKWLLSSYGQLLFFIRDPFVLLVYCLALKHSYFPRNSALLRVGVAFGALSLLLIAFQAVGVASGIEKWPILAAYGWRNYFLYIPLPFVIGTTFQQVDVQRIVKLTFLLAVPIAFLVALQFRSPLDAPVNVGFGASVAQQYRGNAVDMDHTRPTGTFTSDVGQKQFVASGIAMLIALWIAPAARRFVKSWQLVIVTCAVLTCLALSGSRGAVVHCVIIVMAAIGSAAIARGSGASARAVVLPIALAALAVLLYPIIFPESHSVFMDRWNEAQAVEARHFSGGVLGRGLYSFYDFTGLLGDTPLWGYGIGLAGNASLTLGVTIPGFSGWAESDWARHIVDLGPIVGVAFIVYRICLVVWLGYTCAAGTRRLGDPLPFIMFAYIGVELLYGELTGHGSVNGYGWLFAGLCIAAAAGDTRPAAAANDVPQSAIAMAPFPNLMR